VRAKRERKSLKTQEKRGGKKNALDPCVSYIPPRKKKLENAGRARKEKACVRERKHWRESEVHDPGVSYISREKNINQSQKPRTSERKREPACARENETATHMLYVYRVAKTHRVP